MCSRKISLVTPRGETERKKISYSTFRLYLRGSPIWLPSDKFEMLFIALLFAARKVFKIIRAATATEYEWNSRKMNNGAEKRWKTYSRGRCILCRPAVILQIKKISNARKEKGENLKRGITAPRNLEIPVLYVYTLEIFSKSRLTTE
jgi:hypothetical protein